MAYGELDVWCHIFITLIPGGSKWSGSRVGRLSSGEKEWSYHLNRRLVGTQSWSGRLEYDVYSCSSPEPKHVSSCTWPSHWTDYTKCGSRNVSVVWNVFCVSFSRPEYTPCRQRTAAIAVKLSAISLLTLLLNELQSSEVPRCVHQLIIRRNWCEWSCLLVASVRLRVEDENWETYKQSHELGQLNTCTMLFEVKKLPHVPDVTALRRPVTSGTCSSF